MERADLEVFVRGVVDLVTGCETVVRNMQAHVTTWQAGRKPGHKTGRELAAVPDDLRLGKEAVVSLLESGSDTNETAEAPKLAARQPIDRQGESLANETVRQQMLSELKDMDEALARFRSGVEQASQVFGAMAAGGKRPSREELERMEGGCRSGVSGIDQLAALMAAFRQRVEWFDANR